jgi:tellurite resistance-related uncharacterized protein
MLLIIDTKNASHIAINIPSDVADKALPAIVNMFENNATFLNAQYSSLENVKPSITILLGNEFTYEKSSEYTLLIKANEFVLTEDFLAVAPKAYFSVKQTLDNKDKENGRLRSKISILEEELEKLKT